MMRGGRDKMSPQVSTSHAGCTQLLSTWAPESKDVDQGLRVLQGQGAPWGQSIGKVTMQSRKRSTRR